MSSKFPEQFHKDAQERGYYLSDMRDTERKIRERRGQWKHNFMTFIEVILNDDPDKSPDKIVKIADKLADAVEEHLDHKFEDVIGEDD
jgi:lipopolysaccharide biosynthesis regulator YciM